MINSAFVAILVLCGLFAVSEILGKFIHYKIPPIIIFVLAMVVFGGQLGWIPANIVETSTFGAIFGVWVLPFACAGFGTSISLKQLKGELKTCVIAIFAVIVIVLLGALLGLLFMDMRTALYGAIEVAGGGPAGWILLTHAQEVGDSKLVVLILSLMELQLLVAYPLCNLLMRKSMKLRVERGNIPAAPASVKQNGIPAKTSLFTVPAWTKTFYYNFAMLALCCLLGYAASKITGISATVFYILFGLLFAELGLLDHGCLQTSGLGIVLLGIMYLGVCEGFLTIKLTDLLPILINLVILLACGVLGCGISGLIMSKIFKIDIYEATAISLGCMVGYPSSQKITEDAIKAFRADVEVSDDDAARLKAYYEPKIIISGVVTISLLTGILAGIVITFI